MVSEGFPEEWTQCFQLKADLTDLLKEIIQADAVINSKGHSYTHGSLYQCGQDQRHDP